MEQQTALDWFVQQLHETGLDVGSGIKMDYPIPNEILEKAKAMEKKQIMSAYWDGGQDVPTTANRCEQYYNETYENK
jgi:HEPN domain-containing protein